MSPCWTWIVGIFLFRFFSQTIFICRKNMYPNITQHVYWHPIQKHFPHKKVNVVPIPFTITISHPHNTDQKMSIFIRVMHFHWSCLLLSFFAERMNWMNHRRREFRKLDFRTTVYLWRRIKMNIIHRPRIDLEYT